MRLDPLTQGFTCSYIVNGSEFLGACSQSGDVSRGDCETSVKGPNSWIRTPANLSQGESPNSLTESGINMLKIKSSSLSFCQIQFYLPVCLVYSQLKSQTFVGVHLKSTEFCSGQHTPGSAAWRVLVPRVSPPAPPSGPRHTHAV